MDRLEVELENRGWGGGGGVGGGDMLQKCAEDL